MNRATLNKRVDAFLQIRKSSTSGYDQVEQRELEALSGIIDGLLTMKYQADDDGRLPVAVSTTDLTRYQAPSFAPIPHTHKSETGESELELHQSVAERWLLMAAMATKEAQRHSQAVQTLLREAVERNQPLTLGGLRYVVKPPTGLKDRDVANALQKAVDQAYRKEPCPIDFFQRETWSKRIADKVGKKLSLKVHPRTCSHTVAGVRMYFDVPAFDSSIRIDSNAAQGSAPIIPN